MRRYYDNIIIIIIVFTYETDLTQSPARDSRIINYNFEH